MPAAIEQETTQRALQQAQAHARLHGGAFRRAGPHPGPCPFDPAHSLDHECAVMPMRAAMQRQSQADRRLLVAGQQKTIFAKVIEAMALLAKRREHARKRGVAQQLPGQQVMALQAGVEIGPPPAVDRAKGQIGPQFPSASQARLRQTQTRFPTCDGSASKPPSPPSITWGSVNGPWRIR